jgi:hypothetical protein
VALVDAPTLALTSAEAFGCAGAGGVDVCASAEIDASPLMLDWPSDVAAASAPAADVVAPAEAPTSVDVLPLEVAESLVEAASSVELEASVEPAAEPASLAAPAAVSVAASILCADALTADPPSHNTAASAGVAHKKLRFIACFSQ